MSHLPGGRRSPPPMWLCVAWKSASCASRLGKAGPHSTDILHSPGFCKPHHLRRCDCPATYVHHFLFSAGICGCQGLQLGLLCQRLYGRVLETRPQPFQASLLPLERAVKGLLGSAMRTHRFAGRCLRFPKFWNRPKAKGWAGCCPFLNLYLKIFERPAVVRKGSLYQPNYFGFLVQKPCKTA